MEDAHRFQRFAWGVLGYNLLVILWGALVRASGSGAGCGSHWPLCNGEVVPRAPRIETIIEFTHRLTSGFAVIAVAGLFVWALRTFPRGHRVRLAAGLSLLFLFIEALLGAGLVLFEYVARNASAGRAAYLSLHLVNTQILLALLVSTAWLATRRWEGWPRVPGGLKTALAVALAVSVTGAIAALGDTLFPASSVAAGIRQEFSDAAHALLRLRLLHPVVAVAGSLYLLWVARRVRSRTLGALIVVQLLAGVVNVILLAPVWIQIVHLLIADLLWLALVILVLESAGQPVGVAARQPARAW